MDYRLILDDLRARGMAVPDPVAAADFFRRVGTHRAGAYWRPFLAAGGRFAAGVSFSHVVAVHDFDRALRFLALEALEEIEIAVRAEVVRCLAARDPLAHRKREMLRDDFSGHEKWLKQHDAHARRKRRDKMSPVEESAEWWSFGMLSRLFAGMTIADRRAVARNFGDSGGQFTANSLLVMSGVRNVAAHHERFWNTSALTIRPKSPKPGKVEGFDPPPGAPSTSRTFDTLCVIAHFIRRVRPGAKWPGRLRGLLLNEFPKDAPGISPAQMGFPDGWEHHPFWRE